MKAWDIVKLAFQNLCRRRIRTILTAIGVMIGTTSIVVMVSIGSGLDEISEQNLKNMGDLSLITIYNWGGSNVTIDDDMIQSMKQIEGVEVVSPKMRIEDLMGAISTKSGRYKADYLELIGVDFAMLEALNVEPRSGSMELGAATSSTIPVLVGDMAVYNFLDTMRPQGMNRIEPYTDAYFEAISKGKDAYDSLPEPYFNPLNEQLSLKLSSYEKPDASSEYTLNVKGVLKPSQSMYEIQSGMIMDLSTMQRMIADAKKKLGLPAGKTKYNEVYVKAASINEVESIEKELKALGLTNISSMASMRESMKQSARMTQLVLGGIGAVSLIVAAVGITNTMYMSISERTREIGIMKALGCRIRDIQAIFLCEAGMIGLLGGALGALLSWTISVVINFVGWKLGSNPDASFWTVLTTPGQRISVIPIWLVLFGVTFSLGIGLLAGCFPAKKAVKIPALEAIRRE